MFSLQILIISRFFTISARSLIFRRIVMLNLIVAVGMYVVGCGSTSAQTSASSKASSPTATASLETPTPSPTPTQEAPTPTPTPSPTPSPTPTPLPTPTPTANTVCTAQQNMVCGKAVDSRGNPVTNVSVEIFGDIANNPNPGQQFDTITSVDANGMYFQPVPEGHYSVKAYANVSYQGVQWSLNLHPDDNTAGYYYSGNGIVKNFTWLLTGLQPDGCDSSNPACYYGAFIGLQLEPVDSTNRPDGTTYHFTLTPQGKLVDGSTGQTLTFDKTTTSFGDFSGGDDLRNIPLGVYAIRVTATAPDGTQLTLHLNTQTITFTNDVNRQGMTSLVITND